MPRLYSMGNGGGVWSLLYALPLLHYGDHWGLYYVDQSVLCMCISSLCASVQVSLRVSLLCL